MCQLGIGGLLFIQRLLEQLGGIAIPELPRKRRQRPVGSHFVVLHLTCSDNQDHIPQWASIFGGIDHVIRGIRNFFEDDVVLSLGLRADDAKHALQSRDVITRLL